MGPDDDEDDDDTGDAIAANLGVLAELTGDADEDDDATTGESPIGV